MLETLGVGVMYLGHFYFSLVVSRLGFIRGAEIRILLFRLLRLLFHLGIVTLVVFLGRNNRLLDSFVC